MLRQADRCRVAAACLLQVQRREIAARPRRARVYRDFVPVVDGDGRHIVVVELLMLVVAEDDDGINRRGPDELAELFDGPLDAGVLFSEAVGLQLRIEVFGNVRARLLGLAEVGPLFGVNADLGGVGVAHTQDDFSHSLRW